MIHKIAHHEIPKKFVFAVAMLTIAGVFSLAASNVSAAVEQINSALVTENIRKLQQLNLNYILAPDHKTVKFLSSDDGIALSKPNLTTSVAVGKQFFSDYGKYFGVKNFSKELAVKVRDVDDLGMTHVVYEQRLNNVPIYGGQIMLHLTGDLKVQSANGKIVSGVSLATKPKLTTAKALTQAKKYAREKFSLSKIEATTPKLYIFNQNLFDAQAKSKNQLVYVTTVGDEARGLRKILFIDAKTGGLVYTLEDIQTLYRLIYNCNNDAVEDCWLYGADEAGKNGRYEGQTASGIAQVDSLYDLAGSVHEFFQDNYRLDGANNLGGIGGGFGGKPVTSTVGRAYFVFQPGATSTCPNSYWDGNRIVFCENTVNAAIVGHEYMHGVVEFQGPAPKLAYLNESGAINEALADIFGQALENKISGTRSWKIGPDGGVLWRDLTNPEAINDPATHYSGNFYCGDDDNGGVHRNSTVISHAAYLLATGGELNGCTIPQIQPGQVERVFYRALDKYLITHADFEDFYEAANRACHDLYRSHSSVCQAIKTAMQAVELDQPGACSGVAEVIATCQPFYVTYPEVSGIIDNARIPVTQDTETLLNPNILNQIDLTPTIPPISVPDSDLNQNITTPLPEIKVETKTEIEEEVRTPSFSVDVIQNGKNVKVNGVLNYYGKGSKCSGPRYFDPIIVRWGQVDSQPTLKSDNTFTASHEYVVKNKSYVLSVSVTNSCFGSYTFRKTLTFPL